jgi:O-antigen ligase
MSVLGYATEPFYIPSAIPGITPSNASTQERLVSIVGGWKLFVEHPIFGAGLGAFRNELILATSGIPLLIHSTALWLLAELGLVGFLAFAVPAIHVWMTEWRRAPHDQAAAIVALCFLAFAVMSGPADMVYQRTFWFVIGAALALPRPTQEHEPGSH